MAFCLLLLYPSHTGLLAISSSLQGLNLKACIHAVFSIQRLFTWLLARLSFFSSQVSVPILYVQRAFPDLLVSRRFLSFIVTLPYLFSSFITVFHYFIGNENFCLLMCKALQKGLTSSCLLVFSYLLFPYVTVLGHIKH